MPSNQMGTGGDRFAHIRNPLERELARCRHHRMKPPLNFHERKARRIAQAARK